MTKKGILVLIGVVGVIGLIVFIFTGDFGDRKAGISLDSYPPATVYIDDREAGSTPYENDKIKAGETKIKLVPQGGDISEFWEQTVFLDPGTETFISREFDTNPELSGGRLIYLEKTSFHDKAGLIVNCTPDNCSVSVDGQMQGFSPLNLENIGEGERRILVNAPGYKEVEVMARTINGYRLVLKVDLARQEETTLTQLTPTPSEPVLESVVTIGTTPNGWLRVRDGPGTSYPELTKVDSGEEFPFIEEDSGWYKIEYDQGKQGWVSAVYSTKSDKSE